MNEELTRYYESLKDREDENQRVFFDIFAISYNNGNTISTPLVTVQQAGKNASGAETFRKKAETATSRKYDAIQVKEYSRINGEVEYETVFPLKTSKNNRPARKNSFTGRLGNLGDVFEGGLGEIIEMKAASQMQGYELQRTHSDLTEAKAEITKLRSQLEGIKAENDRLVYENRDLKYENKQIQRDAEAKNSFSSIAMNVGLNYLGSKIGLNERELRQLAGLSSDDDDDAAPQTESKPVGSASKSDSEEDRIINKIVNKLYDFDTAKSLNNILAIVELCAKDTKAFDNVFQYAKGIYRSLKGASDDDDTKRIDISGGEDGDDE